MVKKSDFQKEAAKFLDQLKENLKKFSKEAGIFAKKGEKEIVKASKIGRIQIDIASLNIQKEKLYYDLGKKIASLRGSGKEISQEAIEPFMQKLRNIELEARNRKRDISRVRKEESGKKESD